jgi:hypothetical protein
MKRYLFMGLVVLSIGLEAADNPFDLKQNLQSLDKSENFILNELEQVYKTKNKKEASKVEPVTKGRGAEMIHDIVSESNTAETKPETIKVQTTTTAEPEESIDMAVVEENEIAGVISGVVSDAMVEDQEMSEVKEEPSSETKRADVEKSKEVAKPETKRESVESNKTEETSISSHEEMLKMIVQEAPAKEEPKEAVAPARKQPVLEAEESKSKRVPHEAQATETKDSRLTTQKIKEIYEAALKEAEGK